MADFSNIIQEINTNLPDNTDQLITPEMLRDTLIDFVNKVEDSDGDLETAIQNKQDTLTFDATPTENSANPVTSGGIYDSLSNKADKVQNAIAGNFAGLDSNGNIVDSGSKARDFVPTYVAIPNQTTFNEITSALSSEKIVIVNENGRIYTLSAQGSGSYTFTHFRKEQNRILYLTVTPDGWTNGRCDIEDRTNRVSVITGNETSTTKYPNTKAVADALADYVQKSQTAGLLKNDGTVDTTQYGTYSKPSGGIPASDLESSVQTSLGKADTALQSFTETDPTVPSWAKQRDKPAYDYREIKNTPDLSGFITKSVNDLTNYYLKSETYTKAEVNALIGAIQQFHYEIYPTLPASGESNVLYLIGPTGSGADKYEEYVYSNNTFTKIGDTSIDLSGYVTISALNTALQSYTPTSQLAAVATSGDYDDLTNKPTIPTVPVQDVTVGGTSVVNNGTAVIPQEVFVATFNTTTATEITAALADGKTVLCKNIINNTTLMYAFVYDDDTSYFFGCNFHYKAAYCYINKATNRWEQSQPNFEVTSRKVSTIAGNETDTTKYPNTKAVADYAQTLANKVTSFQTTPDDTHYPSEKLVKDSLDTKIDNTDVEELTSIDVDDTPTANSNNLVKSGGVYDYVNPLLGKWGVVSQTLTWDTTNYEYIISNITQGIIPQTFIDLVTAEGAIFNTNSGYFELNGITDIAYDEMKIIYSSRTANGMNTVLSVFGENYTARTNFAVFRGGAVSYSNHQGTVVFSKYLAYRNTSIINFAITDHSYYYASGANNNFGSWGATTLPGQHNRIKKIIGVFDVRNLTGTTQFFYENTWLPQLEEFDMRGISSTKISWGGMPKLKVETIANSVNYANNSAVSTWTIHADAYTRCQADTTEYTYNGNTYNGVLAYASAKNITIASA